ncbi:glycosyltransferase family 4 protein [Mesorhizobium sp. VK25D]|uniref:Glycosyltransferase family 4 protein n=2 Tax=Mesorhizobium vachelliae TaxID=3072309 RepID=A0ABU5A0C1_9HYPH|nr:glycosyltransferase family 4 protein [Mesorhizobium sp. VK25D]MDX8531113.1 glycosyltransferase family 4 protein [Mesorhizobium sp. VK25D]
MRIDGQPLRVAVVAPIMVRRDAISLAVRDTMRFLSKKAGFEAIHLGHACEYPEIAHRQRNTSGELLLDPSYYAADAAVFHFGIHHGLFDALLGGGPRTRIVRFHNVTPPHLVRPVDIPVVERSLRQIEILRRADEIWADSPSNAEYLLERGFDPDKIRVIPLVVEDPACSSLAEKAKDHISVLFVGRIAPSKGIHDLIKAIARASAVRKMLRVTIAGNMHWSDPAYVRELQSLVGEHHLESVVSFTGTIDDVERDRLFRDAHIVAIPSYHEGFCRPVAEGFRAGCVPLVYDAYNLPHIANRLGCVVPTGDVEALAAGLSKLVLAQLDGMAKPDDPVLPLDRGPTSVHEFDHLAQQWVQEFTFERIAARTRERLLRLAGRETLDLTAIPA